MRLRPTWSLELARPLGWRPLAERRSRRARSDPVAAEDHEVGLLPLPDPGHPVDKDRPGRASVPGLDLLDPGVRHEPRARGNRLRPQRQRHVMKRARRAAALACAAIVAAGPSVERSAQDRPRGMAQRCQPSRSRALPARTPRAPCAGGGAVNGPRAGNRRIALVAADTDQGVRGIVVGSQILVGDGPVRRQSMLDALCGNRSAGSGARRRCRPASSRRRHSTSGYFPTSVSIG